jgi:hypothetical protein
MVGSALFPVHQHVGQKTCLQGKWLCIAQRTLEYSERRLFACVGCRCTGVPYVLCAPWYGFYFPLNILSWLALWIFDSQIIVYGHWQYSFLLLHLCVQLPLPYIKAGWLKIPPPGKPLAPHCDWMLLWFVLDHEALYEVWFDSSIKYTIWMFVVLFDSMSSQFQKTEDLIWTGRKSKHQL